MNICFVLEHAHPHYGGVETAFHELGKKLVEKGHTVTVLTSQSGGKTATQSVSGIQYHYFPWKSYFGHAIPEKIDIEPYIKTADIIHTTTYTAAPLTSHIAQKYHKPCILTVHEVLGGKWFWVEDNPLKAVLYYLFERFVLYHHFTHYHAVSASTKKDLVKAGIPTSKISVIYHGVSKEFNTSQSSTSLSNTFLYYGRPGKTKGIFILLKAIQLICERLPKQYSFQFILSNDPPTERRKFENLVKEYNLEGRVTICTSLKREELIRTILNVYCVIVPSITEGFGFTAAEASSLDKPLIISDAGSLPEVASGKVLQFKNRDSIDLGEKILQATRDLFDVIPEKKFDWEITVSQMEKLYNTLRKTQ